MKTRSRWAAPPLLLMTHGTVNAESLGLMAVPAGLTVVSGVSALALCHLDMPVAGGTDFTSLLQAETRSRYPEAASFAFASWA